MEEKALLDFVAAIQRIATAQERQAAAMERMVALEEAEAAKQ